MSLNPTTRTNSSVIDATVLEAAARLRDADATGTPVAPVRDLIGRDNVQAAYAVQQVNVELRRAKGARVSGRKIGLTSPAVQQQLGVDQPDFGVLFSDMEFSDGDAVAFETVLQPKVEAEIAFMLGNDLDEGGLAPAQVANAIEYAVAAIEVCGSRVADWDISFADTVADNASAGVYVLSAQRRALDEVTPSEVVMSMMVDDREVSTGSGAACLGDPLNAVSWLARTSRELGEPLLAGQIVLSGALGPMWTVHPGARVAASISGLGTVAATFPSQEDT